MRKSVLFCFILIVVLVLVNIGLHVVGLRSIKHGDDDAGLWNSQRIRAYAHTLVSKGLPEEAAAMYEAYISQTDDPVDAVAKVCYRLGELYMDAFMYEKALTAFYRAEILDPKAAFVADMDQRIVEALENLGMTEQARYEMGKRTQVTATRDASGAVVARIGTKNVTEAEIIKALDAVPDWMKEKYTSEEGKEQFLTEYVTREVLYQKAKRLGIDAKKETREAVQQFQKQVIIQALIEREVGSQISIKDEDVDLFYKANKENYVEPQAVKIAYALVVDDAVDAAQETLQKDEGETIDAWIAAGATTIPTVGEAADQIKTLLLAKNGDVTDPLKVGDAVYVFKVTDTRPERQKSFDEVKDQVGFELRMKKERELMSSLIGQTIEEQQVEIFGFNGEK